MKRYFVLVLLIIIFLGCTKGENKVLLEIEDIYQIGKEKLKEEYKKNDEKSEENKLNPYMIAAETMKETAEKINKVIEKNPDFMNIEYLQEGIEDIKIIELKIEKAFLEPEIGFYFSGKIYFKSDKKINNDVSLSVEYYDTNNNRYFERDITFFDFEIEYNEKLDIYTAKYPEGSLMFDDIKILNKIKFKSL